MIFLLFFILTNEYKINVGDVIFISVPNVDAIGDRTLTVNYEGKIFMPIVGEIDVISLTKEQLKDSIVGVLSPYVKKPLVFVNIIRKGENKLFIFGEVASPGMYRFDVGCMIGDALHLAGGVKSSANLEKIEIRRQDTTIYINLNKGEEILVSPGDIIFVHKYEEIIILGELIYPYIFTPTSSKISLATIISRPLPYTRNSNLEKIKIIGSSSKIVNIVDAPNVYLSPGDIIIILSKKNILRDLWHFTNTAIPLVTFILMIGWHYHWF